MDKSSADFILVALFRKRQLKDLDRLLGRVKSQARMCLQLS